MSYYACNGEYPCFWENTLKYSGVMSHDAGKSLSNNLGKQNSALATFLGENAKKMEIYVCYV